MKNNKNLHKAKKHIDDEFYTLYEDIEKEIENYKDELKGKVIYCNCDNPKISNFIKYFKNNKEKLKYKELIYSWYNDEKGSFCSEENIILLKKADIVISNPPFSLFDKYYKLLKQYNKKFLIIGNYLYCKNILKELNDGEVFFGKQKRNMKFKKPNGDIKEVNSIWYQNIKEVKHNKKTQLKGNTKDLKKFDDSELLNCNSYKEIPDINEEIAVPITFLERINREQFEIKGLKKGKIEGKNIFIRVVIKQKGKTKNEE